MERKTDGFSPDLNRLAELASALSHPARLRILQVLGERGTCICGEMVDELPLAQATVSRHLKTLKDSGLVRGEIDGPRSCYCLDQNGVQELRHNVSGFLDSIPDVTVQAECC